MSKRSFWQIRALPERFFVGGNVWGALRLIAVLFVTFMFARWSRFIYSDVISVPPPLFSLHGLRFWVMPFAALVGALLVGAHYVRDVYELPKLRLSIRYLVSAAFAILHPRLAIRDGRKVVKEDEINLLEAIGGPGYVSVGPGSVVLLERLNAPSNVYGVGGHYVTRQERIKAIATLEDQHGYIESVPATSIDGIGVMIRDVHYRYRLRTGRQLGDYTLRSPENPFPYSVQAMRNYTYERTVDREGLESWHRAVERNVIGAISDYIYKHNIDFLTAPRADQEQDPRAEIHRELFSTQTRERLRRIGAELLWVDIGHFDVVIGDVDEQRISTWRARWRGRSELNRAYGEAQRLAYEELGRAEAQAEMLISILHSLDEADLLGGPPDNLRNLILVRTAQILDAISEDDKSFKTYGSLPPSKSTGEIKK